MQAYQQKTEKFFVSEEKKKNGKGKNNPLHYNCKQK